MTEQWRPVPGCEGHYEVSDLGGVRGLRSKHGPRRRPRRVRPSPSAGYPAVSLSKGGVVFSAHVHRLVLLAFVGPCPEGMETRHLDGTRLNAKLSNLQWGTRKRNAEDRVEHGTQARGANQGLSKLDDEGVASILSQLVAGEAAGAVARGHGVSEATVGDIRRGRTWTHVPRPEGVPSARPTAKLRPEDVRAIRAALAAGERGMDVAARFAVSKVTVSMIKTGKRWGHV